jgi:hypothetical protein
VWCPEGQLILKRKKLCARRLERRVIIDLHRSRRIPTLRVDVGHPEVTAAKRVPSHHRRLQRGCRRAVRTAPTDCIGHSHLALIIGAATRIESLHPAILASDQGLDCPLELSAGREPDAVSHFQFVGLVKP